MAKLFDKVLSQFALTFYNENAKKTLIGGILLKFGM